MYDNARYYDPARGQFLSADSIVPGAGALTLSPHDPTAVAAWGGSGGGPANLVALNRYAYTENNPIKYTDPTGHCIGPVLIICVVAGDALVKAAVATVVTLGVLATAAVAGDAAGRAYTEATAPAEAPPLPPVDDLLTRTKQYGNSPTDRDYTGTDAPETEYDRIIPPDQAQPHPKVAGGKIGTLPDGSIIGFRPTSDSTKGPAIDLHRVPGKPPVIKVKFPKKGE